MELGGACGRGPVIGLAALHGHQLPGEAGEGIGAVGHDGVGVEGHVRPQGHGVGPRADLFQKVGGTALEGDGQRPVIRRGDGQQGGVPGLLDLLESGDLRQERPVGQAVGRVRQTPPREDEGSRLHRRPVGPDRVLAEGEGVGGVARVIGLQGVVLRLAVGQDGPAVPAVLPAQEVFIEMVQDGLAAPGGNGGGVKGDHHAAGADGQHVRLDRRGLAGGIAVFRLFAAGAQEQGQQGAQQGAVFLLSRQWAHGLTWPPRGPACRPRRRRRAGSDSGCAWQCR